MTRKRILCVDDSNVILLMERLVLSKAGYELVTASNGEEAIERAALDRPDLILLDIVMPRMSGIETCRLLRQQSATSRVPIIMVTTRSEEANVEDAFRTGCNDYVVKPIDAVELLAKVRNYLGEAS